MTDSGSDLREARGHGLDRWEAERSGALRSKDPAGRSAERVEEITSSGLRMLLVYGLPIVAINLTGHLGGRTAAAIVWPLAFLVMGAGCVTNAIRCGRVHCYFTGPLFLLAGLLSALLGLRVIDLGSRPWETIGYGTFALALVLYFGPEAIWGKFFRGAVRH